jgi:Xaa-Pro dipeptidase
VGMTELQLSAELERELRFAGHHGHVRFRGFNQELFYGSVLAGPSAAVPGATETPIVGPGSTVAVPKGASQRPIQRGEPIIVDLCGTHEGYLADQTRTFSLGPLGRGPWREAYARAREVLAGVAADARPGATPSALWERAASLAAGRERHFMGGVSFVGHGFGLEIDELPVLAPGFDDPLEPGTVFALEPKFVFPGEGAVGIENSYVVREGGVECLTSAPEELIEL